MSTPSIEQLYQEGVAALRAGDKATGRDKLMQVIRLDEAHELAWLWLSGAVETNEERIICLENVLTLNPNNQAAQRGLEKLKVSMPPAPRAPSSPPVFTPPSSAPPTPPVQITSPSPPPLVPDPPLPALGGATLPADEGMTPVSTPQPPATAVEAALENATSESEPDSWRSAMAIDASKPEAAASVSVPVRESIPSRNIMDLFDAWVAAILFNKADSFVPEMRVANWGRVLVNLLFGAFVTGMTLFLRDLIASSLLAGSAVADVASLQTELETLGLPVQATTLVTAITAIGAILLVVLTIVFQLLGGAVIHLVSRVMGGSGTFVQTLHALTLAIVAQDIVALLPTLLLPFLASVFPPITLLYVLALAIYGIALTAISLSVAHSEFGVGRALVVLIVSGVVVAVLFCLLSFCLALGLGPMVAVGAQ